MPLERLLQIMMAGLVALATLMLGMGEQNPLLPALAVLVSASSVYFTDIKGWIRLNTSVANLAGLAAVVASLWDYRTVSHEHQLLALANLLIYLQCVLLYRRKSTRIYWMLALLSLLQVAVATVLNLTIWFGILLVIYLFMAVATLAVFLIYREQSRFEGASRRRAANKLGQQAASLRSQRASGVPFMPRAPDVVFGDEMPRGLTRLVLRMGIYTLALTALLFIVVPRTGGSSWGEQAGEVHHTVGFAEKVSLGEMGEIIENPEEVLQIRFLDHDTDEPYRLNEVPLLRGSILSRYFNGAWHESRRPSQAVSIPLAPEGRRGLVRQEVQIDKLDTTTLFAIYPLLLEKSDSRLVFDKEKDRLTRSQGVYRFPLNYQLLTSGLRDGKQLPIIPATREPHYLDDLLQMPREHPLPKLRQLAQQVVARGGGEAITVRAKLLEHHLRDSGKYGYTLSPAERNPQIDPIEDFLFEHPQGHCEYFASALTLMLRSVGIPARMIVGFKGADWNPLSGYYHVRQLHAHTWVEVYLAPDQIPIGTVGVEPVQAAPGAAAGANSEWKHGAWLQLDPTPSIGAAEFVPADDGMPSLKQLFDYADYLWSGYVLSMDRRRQQERIFNPVKKGSEGIVSVLFDRQLWRKTFQNLGKILRGERIDDGGIWFSWRAAFITIVGLLLLVGLYRAISWLVRRLFHLNSDRRERSGEASSAQAEFYRRLEALLAEQRLVRSATQTQREFAGQAQEHLARRAETMPVALLPRRIADAYYQVRFGGRPLDNQETVAVEQALDELATTLSTANGRDNGADGHPG